MRSNRLFIVGLAIASMGLIDRYISVYGGVNLSFASTRSALTGPIKEPAVQAIY